MSDIDKAIGMPRGLSTAGGPRLRLAGQGGVLVLAAILLLLPWLLRSGFQYHMAVMIGIHAVIAIGLNLLVGYAGQISLGHAGFMAIGAYGTAILSSRFGWPPLLGVVVSAAAAGLLAFAVGRPILRLKGYYLAMATLGLGMIIYLLISNEVWLTGGPDGLSLPMLSLFGQDVDSPKVWYGIVAVLLLVAYWMAGNLVNSPLGRALRSLEGPEALSAAAGVDVSASKVRIFTVSAVVTAFMGGIGALYAGFISPKSADFMQSIELVLMVIVGGMGSIPGAVAGAAIVTLLPQVLTAVEHYEPLIYGLILILVMVLMPKGLVPTLAHRLRRSRS